jgi:hypothetical protein
MQAFAFFARWNKACGLYLTEEAIKVWLPAGAVKTKWQVIKYLKSRKSQLLLICAHA